jgi:periplasmic protein TonB
MQDAEREDDSNAGEVAMAAPSPNPDRTTAVGHLSVRIDGEHPADVPFMFERVQKRGPGAAVASLSAHAALAALVFVVGVHYEGMAATDAKVIDPIANGIVWLAQPGPGGGGGGGGNQMKLPPRRAELPGKDQLTVPVTTIEPVLQVPKPAEAPPEPAPEIPQLNIPAKALASGATPLAGTLDGVPGSASQGPGTGGGAGGGNGTGIGNGLGDGLGEGRGGGTNGGAYQPGSGVSLPRLLREVRPDYTAEAMRAKIQGTATVEALVLPDGSVGAARIVKSLDASFGLDQAALKAARQWRFVPGMRNGVPVPVYVTIELTFSLR